MLRRVRFVPCAALLAMLLASEANARLLIVYARYDSAPGTCQGSVLGIVSTPAQAWQLGGSSYVEIGSDICHPIEPDDIADIAGGTIQQRVSWYTYQLTLSHFPLMWSSEWGWHIFRPRTTTPEKDGKHYEGLCIRPLDMPSYVPPWIRSSLPKHHDVRTRSEKNGVTETTRGFFAANMWLAVRAAVMSRLNPRRYDGFVAGVVEDTATTASGCNLSSVTTSRYNTVFSRIRAASGGRYHLLDYNCQDWAAEQRR